MKKWSPNRMWRMTLAGSAWLLLTAVPAGSLSYDEARERMVRDQLKGRDISDARVLDAMSRIPRHLFVPAPLADDAYNDHPLPIGEGQTISQPYVVALMTQLLRLRSGERVLEIGTGSGYQAAVLGEMTDQVYSIEIRPALAKEALRRLRNMGYDQVQVTQGDGYFGWKEAAPFDAIIVTAAANHIPPPLLKQLKPGGRLVLPLGSTTFFQTLTLVTKKTDGSLDVQHLDSVSFVPMIGRVEK